MGSGRSELARAISGADPIDARTVRIDGEVRKIRSPTDAISAGIAFLTEERKKDGLFMELSLAANTTFADIPAVSGGGSCAAARSGPALVGSSSRSRSTPVAGALAKSLSGGNQQKVLFARWLFSDPKVLILDEPTRGVDVGARAAIHRLIHDLAEQGTAVLMISSEIEEVLGLAHRVLVMRRGSITREFPADPPLGEVMEAVFGLPGGAVMTARTVQRGRRDRARQRPRRSTARFTPRALKIEHVRDYGIIVFASRSSCTSRSRARSSSRPTTCSTSSTRTRRSRFRPVR